jgi:membrane-associated phospholipid phosphatase
MSSSHGGRRIAALTAGVTGAGTVACGVWAASHAGARIDQRAVNALAARGYSSSWENAFLFSNHVPQIVALAAIAVSVAAFIRRGTTEAIAMWVLIALSILLSDALKHSAVVHSASAMSASWPSAHTAALTAVTLCAVAGAERRWERWACAIVGIITTVATSIALMMTRSHRPSDLVGGCLMTVFVAAAVRTVVPVRRGTECDDASVG